MFCIVTVLRVLVVYCNNGTCTCSVLWHLYVYMFFIVRMVRVHFLYSDNGTCTCSVLCLCYVYMFCIVRILRVHVLYCDSGTATCSVLWQWYSYVFCVCDIGRREKRSENPLLVSPSLCYCLITLVMRKLQIHAAHHVLYNIKTHRL